MDRSRRLVAVLAHGSRADWAQNIIAGDGAIETEAGLQRISAAHVVGRSASWPFLPLPVRLAFRVLRVQDFLVFTVERDTSQ